MKRRIPLCLHNERRSVCWFYKRIEHFICTQQNLQKEERIAIPSIVMRKWGDQCGLSEDYAPVLTRFVKKYRLLDWTGFTKGENGMPGQCRKYWINKRFVQEYDAETELIGTNSQPQKIEVDVEHPSFVSERQWADKYKAIYQTPLKLYRVDLSAAQIINEQKWEAPVKETQLENLFGDTRAVQYKHNRRMYTTWATTPRVVRHLATIDGEPLTNFDFQNFHPSVAAHLANDETLIAVCEQGELYQKLMQECGITDRELVKEQVLAYLNINEDRHSYKSKQTGWYEELIVGFAVRELFPITAAFITRWKTENHKFMNKILTVNEWAIMNPICNAIHKHIARPAGKHILPLHDGVYVPRSIADDAEQLISILKPKRMHLKREDPSLLNYPAEMEMTFSF